MSQFISINLAYNGSDPIYILSKNLTVRIQSEKAFHIEFSTILSSTINLSQYFNDLSNLDDLSDLSDLSDFRDASDLRDVSDLSNKKLCFALML